MFSNDLVCDILEYIDNNLYCEISIDLLSSIFCYDKYYIMKLFKRETGISIFNYINSMKVLNSLKYYKYNYSILKISIESNFNSLEYYSEMFKKIMKVSPFSYKKFINYDVRVSQLERELCLSSIIELDNLKTFVSKYKANRKPVTAPVMKLTI